MKLWSQISTVTSSHSNIFSCLKVFGFNISKSFYKRFYCNFQNSKIVQCLVLTFAFYKLLCSLIVGQSKPQNVFYFSKMTKPLIFGPKTKQNCDVLSQTFLFVFMFTNISLALSSHKNWKQNNIQHLVSRQSISG